MSTASSFKMVLVLEGPNPMVMGPPAMQNEQPTLAYDFTGMGGLAATSSQY